MTVDGDQTVVVAAAADDDDDDDDGDDLAALTDDNDHDDVLLCRELLTAVAAQLSFVSIWSLFSLLNFLWFSH